MKGSKKIIICFLCALAGIVSAAQETAKVPMTVSISDASSNIPPASRNYLTTRMTAAITRNGMGATDDFCQFYMSCTYSVVDKHIIPGAPTKYFQTIEMNFFVVDAFAQKVFTNEVVETKGVGNSEEQANTAAIRQITASNSALAELVKKSNLKIINYYNEQYKNIIVKARSLAKVYQYEEALFHLSLIPEACIGYQEAVTYAAEIYQKYLDDKANKALAKATAIWNAGQNSLAAAEAGVYIAEILPDASCYPQAVQLSNEIKERVKSDIDYYRKRDEKTEELGHTEAMATISAWKAVGVAYGNNQKSVYYYSKSLY